MHIHTTGGITWWGVGTSIHPYTCLADSLVVKSCPGKNSNIERNIFAPRSGFANTDDKFLDLDVCVGNRVCRP